MPGNCVRGEVVYIDLDPARGSEPNKVRPCVGIQNDIGKKFPPITIVAAITGAERVNRTYPVDVPVPAGEGGLDKKSVIQCNLLSCVDESRIVRRAGTLSPATMLGVDRALKISLGIS